MIIIILIYCGNFYDQLRLLILGAKDLQESLQQVSMNFP